MEGLRCDGSGPALTAKTPAPVPSKKAPPRTKAPGRLSVPLCPPGSPGPPTQLKSLPRLAGQFVQLTAVSAQSATHSFTLPTMSNAPHTDWQLDREPVFAGSAPVVTHVVVRSSATPASGVPAAAP